MIDLKLYKNNKEASDIISFLNGLVKLRNLYNDFKKVAECDEGKYKAEEQYEARELIKGGFVEFVHTLKKITQ